MNTTKALALILFFALAAVGCAGLPIDQSKVISAPDGADQAATIILASYGHTGTDRPTVYWYGPDAVDCWFTDAIGLHPGTTIYGACVDGGGQGDDIVVLVDYFGVPLHATALAHELAHWAYNVDGHPVDIFGTDEEGGSGGRVGVAAAALRDAGL